MQKDTLDDLFENLKGEFDINTPNNGHEQRFLNKLNTNKNLASSTDTKISSRFNWKPFLAIAASVIMCLSVFTVVNSQNEVMDLASVSPELSETQDFFTATIETELKKLNQERSPLTQKIVDNALTQIEALEKDYETLKIDLTENGDDQRVIYAMISNFQSRIDILNFVLTEIENLKQLKTNETTNTI